MGIKSTASFFERKLGLNCQSPGSDSGMIYSSFELKAFLLSLLSWKQIFLLSWEARKQDAKEYLTLSGQKKILSVDEISAEKKE